jgi:hypothetical protein
MNIIDIQDSLKNFSEDQLIKEMQMPSGNAPQFLVLSEIQRRKRVRDDFSKRQAAQEPTVAEEAVAAAGVPMQGIAGMSEAMAPQSAASEGIGTIMPQAMRPQAPPAAPVPDDIAMGMRSGGLMSYGEELSSRMSDDKIDPFLDEVEQMATDRFGFEGSEGTGGLTASRPSFPQPVRPGKYDTLPPRRGGLKGGPIAHIMPYPMQSSQFRGPVQRYDEGGVVKAQNGLPLGLRQRNPGNIRPGAGFIGESGDGGGYATFGSDDEGLRAIQRLLMTYGDKYDIKTLRQLANRYAPPSDNNPTGNYIDFLSDKTGIGPDDEINLAESGSSIIPAIVGFEQGQQPYSQAQIDRAIRAAGTDDPAKVSEILGQSLDDVLSARGVSTSDLFQSDAEPSFMSAMAASPVNQTASDNSDSDGYDLMRRLGYSEDDIEKAKAKGVPPEFFEIKKGFNEGVLSEEGIRTIDGSSTDQSDIPLRGDSGLGAVTAIENLAPARMTGEERGERSAYEASLRDDESETDDKTSTTPPASSNEPIKPTAPAAPKVKSEASSLEAEILKMQDDLKKGREQDKWLAIAQAGLALMSSKEPTLLGAAGEAGVSGLKAYRESQDRYQEGVIDLINARSKLKKSSDKNVITRDVALREAINLETDAAKPENFESKDALLARAAQLRGIAGISDISLVN